MIVDLRSDTVTRPSDGMRAAIAQAEVGDDVYGEDPTVRALEERVAGLLGHEAGLFVPSGSLGNQLGLRLLCGPGQEVLCDPLAHIARAELGAAAVFSAITFRTWARDAVIVDELRALATPDAGPYLVSTAAVALENTHNFGGGTVLPPAVQRAVLDLASSLGLATHLDGARLWNAHVATGLPLDHVNGHLHLHLHPTVFRILMEDAPQLGAHDRAARAAWLWRATAIDHTARRAASAACGEHGQGGGAGCRARERVDSREVGNAGSRAAN